MDLLTRRLNTIFEYAREKAPNEGPKNLASIFAEQHGGVTFGTARGMRAYNQGAEAVFKTAITRYTV